MAAPSTQQYDFVTGLDFSAVTSVTKAQLLAAINRIAPLANIGGVVCFSSQNGVIWPGVANNPRFKRYLWIDTYTTPPALKEYDQSGNDTYAAWTSALLADNSVGTNQLQDDAVTVDKIFTPAASARYVMRVNAAGDAVEFAAPSSLFADNEIDLLYIDNSTAADKAILQNVSAGVTWSAIATVAADIIAAVTSIALTKLAYAGTSEGDVIYVEGGVPTWKNLTMAAIKGSGAAGLIPRWSGTTWVPSEIGLSNWMTPQSSSPYTVADIASSPGFFGTSHNLSGVPRFVRAVLVNKTAEAGFIANDEVEIGAMFYFDTGGDAFHFNSWPVSADVTSVFVTLYNTYITSTMRIMHKTTGAFTTFTPANWYVKLYAAY